MRYDRDPKLHNRGLAYVCKPATHPAARARASAFACTAWTRRARHFWAGQSRLSEGGMSHDASDYSVVPLCSDCHTQAPGAYHRAGKGTFERRHGLSFAGIVARLNREWQARCA